jgi:hypothetical protein
MIEDGNLQRITFERSRIQIEFMIVFSVLGEEYLSEDILFLYDFEDNFKVLFVDLFFVKAKSSDEFKIFRVVFAFSLQGRVEWSPYDLAYHLLNRDRLDLLY